MLSRNHNLNLLAFFNALIVMGCGGISSCNGCFGFGGEKETIQSNLEIVLFEKAYSDTDTILMNVIEAIATPFEKICEKKKNVFFLTTTIKRKDLGSKEANIEFINKDKNKNKGDVDKIKFVIREFGRKFRASLNNPLLAENNGTDANSAFETFRSNSKSFNTFYLTLSDEDRDTAAIKGTDNLRQAITKLLCANLEKIKGDERLDKIVVVIKPKSLLNPIVTENVNNTTVLIAETNGSIQQVLLSLADNKVSSDDRLGMVSNIHSKYFTSASWVKRVAPENNAVLETWTKGAKDYLVRLSALTSVQNIQIVEQNVDAKGKVVGLVIKEFHQSHY